MKPIDRSYCLLVANDNQSPDLKKDLYLRSLKFWEHFSMNSSKFLVPLYPMYFRRLFARLSILVSSRNCFSRELSCTSSKLGKIQAFCWDSNLRYVLNVRQMPYCHVNFFQGLHISFLLQWLWRQYFLIFFFPKDVNWTCLYLISEG